MSGEPSDSAGDQAGEDQTSASARASGRQKSKRQLVVRNGETGIYAYMYFKYYLEAAAWHDAWLAIIAISAGTPDIRVYRTAWL